MEPINLKPHEKWSPEQISGWLELNEAITISHETIYQHIWQDRQHGGTLFKALRRKGKKYQLRSKDKQAGRGCIKNRVSINDRPQVFDVRSKIGGLEIVLVIGKATVVH
jgi:IS30 family transposase